MKKVVLILGIIVGVWVLYTTLSNKASEQKNVQQQELTNSSVEEVAEIEEVLDEVDPIELKREQMAAAFAELKEARKLVKMRLSRLSSRLRRAKFSPEQAKQISKDMRRGNYLLKNPKLLGAFSSVAEINKERKQLSDVDSKLDAVKLLLDEKRQQKP